MSGDDQSERAKRVTINKEFESFDAFFAEYVSNVSRTGAFIRSDSPLPVGTLVNLKFTVLTDDIEVVEGVGEVVRVHDDPAGMGVVFKELSSYSQGIIDRLLVSNQPDAVHLVPGDSRSGESGSNGPGTD